MSPEHTPAAAHPLCPYRFSARPEEMIRFLETLGLVRRVTTSGDFFGVMAAAEGFVAVHGLAPDRPADTGAGQGETQLVFLAEDARHTAGRLQEDGLPAIWWDESYGRHAGLTGPHGEGIWFNEDGDHHGYTVHTEGDPDPGLRVVVVRGCRDQQADVDFFAHLGYRSGSRPGSAEESAAGAASGQVGWLELSVPDAPSGVIGLHGLGGDIPAPAQELPPGAQNPAGINAPVLLGFQTREDLTGLAARLTAAGHSAEVVDGDAPAVVVNDPDGRRLEIHQW